MLKKQYLFYIYIIFIFLNITNILAYVKRQDDVSTNSTVISNPPNDNIDSNPAINNNNTSSDITSNPNNEINNDTTTDPSNNINDDPNNDNDNENDINDDPSNTSNANDNQNIDDDKKVKSKIDSIYGSVEIEYVRLDKKDNLTLKLIIYFSIIGSMIALVCLVHLAVWMRPKIIEKRMKKRKAKTMSTSESNTYNMSSRNNSLNNFGMEELKDVKLKDESPEGSMDFTSSYIAHSSTEYIINVDKNSSNKNYRRKSAGSNKSYRKND